MTQTTPTDDPPTPSESSTSPPATPPTLAASTRRRLSVEVALILAVGVIPPLADAVMALLQQQHGASVPPSSFTWDALWLILRSLQVGAVALYVIWRCAQDRRLCGSATPGWSDHGLVPPRASDAAWAAGLFVVVWIAEQSWWTLLLKIPGFEWLTEVLPTSPTAALFATPMGLGEWGLLAVMSLANGFAEQVVLCGVLLTRLVRLLGHRGQAVSTTAICFVSYHVYQGWEVVVLLLPMGVLFGWFFLWRRRLWPLVLAHAAFDFTAYAWSA